MITSETQWDIKKVLLWSTEYLAHKGSPSARLDAELLLSHTLGLPRLRLYTDFDKLLSLEQRAAFRVLLQRRAAQEPVAYILGQREFMGLNFSVTPAVLIPRPDTECLVEAVLADTADAKALSILDVGTGSGCIAISLERFLAKAQVAAQVEAWDLSPAALELAQRNAQQLGADVRFQLCNALLPETWTSERLSSLDILVSNPPYITRSEYADLAPSVRDFEPELALVAEAEGLLFYQSLIKTVAGKHPGTRPLRVYFEIGATQGAAVQSLMQDAGFVQVEVRKDYGRRDRIVTGLLQQR